MMMEYYTWTRSLLQSVTKTADTAGRRLQPLMSPAVRGWTGAGGRGTHAEVLALLGSRLVDLSSREMLTTSTLEPVMTLQGFFKLGDFPTKRTELPNGGFKPLTTPPGAMNPETSIEESLRRVMPPPVARSRT